LDYINILLVLSYFTSTVFAVRDIGNRTSG